MAEAEESEMTEQLGLVLRQVTGSGLQSKEMLERRRQMNAMERQREDQQRHATEAQVAGSIRRDVYDREFWRTAGSESIADRVTVAGALAGEHPEARTAYMHASDVLRDDYGINIEQMNRDHPTSSADRHHALRQALDDYFAKHRLDAESDATLEQPGKQSQTAERTSLETEPAGIEAEQDAINARSPGAAAEYAAAQQLSEDTDVDADVQRLTEQQADPQAADREAVQHTLSSYFPQEQSQQPEQTDAAAQQATASERGNLADAQRYAAEQRRDTVHARAEEQTGGRQPHPYQAGGARERPHQRMTAKEFSRVAKGDPQAAESRQTAAQNFPRSTRRSAQASQAPQARKNVSRVGAQQSKQKDMELSR